MGNLLFLDNCFEELSVNNVFYKIPKVNIVLNEKERAMIEKFVGTHFPKGYTMSVNWDACNEFDRYPAFGEPCKTCKVLFVSP